jgi:propanol-preferring alcohol dehydrogenase
MTDIASILCAGVTTNKGLKETDTRPGQWVAISGIGGLGHVAVQYAKAMGLHVAAIDVAEIDAQIGGAHGVLVTAVSPIAFRQGIAVTRRGGTCVLNGLSPGDFPVPIFDVELKRITIRGSIVGTRKDLQEALARLPQLRPIGKCNCLISRHRE